jgi:2-polyprenyl-6-methoxyphenol hydroxylase-like FAD-dependent oxidoreductase
MAARFEVLVRGSGCVGLALSLALARIGLRVAVQGRAPAADAQPDDLRAFALNAASVGLLRDLKVWDALPANAKTAVYEMRVDGDADAAARGRIEFSAWQQRCAELAWIVDAAALERELAQAIRFSPHIEVCAAQVDADLIALCEGADSSTRAALHIEVERHAYGQRAIAARLVADLPHHGIARQWFGAPDVLALLPLDQPAPGRSYALVWSLPNARAQELLALDAPAFEQALNQASEAAAGVLALASARAAWPLASARAGRWCTDGVVLLGDAAHVVHPLAGQGLNLGLADVTALVDVLAGRESWRPLSDPKLLRRYARARAAPTWAMRAATDGLWRLFAEPGWPARELRNRGLSLVNHLPPVKRWLAAQAIES